MIAGISYTPIPVFELGPLSLSLHGLFAGIGFVVGAWIMLREIRRRGFDVEKTTSALTWALVGAILGARLFTVPAHITDAGYGIGDIVGVSGDYSILGGFAGGIIVGLWRARMLGITGVIALPYIDAAAPGLAIGAVVGRIGDLAIVEHLGSPTSFFLGFTVKGGYDLAPQHDVLECLEGICGTYHHSALYDLIGAVALLGALLYLRKFWSTRHYGQLFAVWMMWYGFQRFLIDFTRLDAAKDGLIADSVMGPFTGSQWGALATAVGGAALFALFARQQRVTPEHDIELGAVPEAVEA